MWYSTQFHPESASVDDKLPSEWHRERFSIRIEEMEDEIVDRNIRMVFIPGEKDHQNAFLKGLRQASHHIRQNLISEAIRDRDLSISVKGSVAHLLK